MPGHPQSVFREKYTTILVGVCALAELSWLDFIRPIVDIGIAIGIVVAFVIGIVVTNVISVNVQ